MNTSVDNYFDVGCGRCNLVGTPQCKVNTWIEPLIALRNILLETELTEELKWSQPCYTIDGKNVLILAAFKGYCFISFFKGVLIKDPEQLLEKIGENTHGGRHMRFRDVQQVLNQKETIRAYVSEAIEIERKGLKTDTIPKKELEIPAELLEQFKVNPALEKAFFALTLGRQKGYVLYFSGAKQSATRHSRIEKYIPKIMEGSGFHDR